MADIEAPLSVSMVTSDDKDAPRLTIRASNVQQLQSQLGELEAAGVLVDIGRVAALFQVKARFGAQLGATPLDPDTDGGSFANVKAAATTPPATPTEKPQAATTPPAAPAKKAGGFPSFKAPAAAAKASATAAPATSTRSPAEAPPAAPAKDGFPQAPIWKKQ